MHAMMLPRSRKLYVICNRIQSELTTIYKCSICHENKLEVANFYILKRCKYTKLLMKQKLLKHCIVDLKISDKTEQTTLSNISDSIICHMSELFFVIWCR